MSDFIKTKSRRQIQGSIDPQSEDPAAVEALSNSLITKLDTLKNSELYLKILEAIEGFSFTKVRCVALGSPSQEEPALYQLAMLKAIGDDFKIKPSDISLYDPVFSPLDLAYFKSVGYVVEKDYKPCHDTSAVLFFLPHAPLSLTSFVLTQEPQLLLANNVIRHTERLTKADLFEKHPLISKLVHSLDPTGDNIEDDGFQSAPQKKKRRQKNKFTEPKIDYQSISSYFKEASMVSFKDYEEGPWINSFTDLAFHRLS